MQRVCFDELSEADRGIIERHLDRHMYLEPMLGEQACRAFGQMIILKHTAGQSDSSYPPFGAYDNRLLTERVGETGMEAAGAYSDRLMVVHEHVHQGRPIGAPKTSRMKLERQRDRRLRCRAQGL